MKPILRNGYIVILGLILFVANSWSAIAAGWTMTDLGAGFANDINNTGQVVGASNGHAVIWNNGTMTDLGTLGLGNGDPDYSFATGVNNVGQVVGNSSYYSPTDVLPFVWANGTMTQLSPTGVGSTAYTINDLGQVVGFSTALGKAWSYGVNLNVSHYQTSFAFDINNAGQVVGYGSSSNDYEALLWYNGTVAKLNALNVAYAINEKGQVAGTTVNGDAVIWYNGNFNVIGPAGPDGFGKLIDINNNGQVVGSILKDNYSPYLWNNGTTIYLNSLVEGTGWILDSANSINDKGQIVGEGTFNGASHAFLLTPPAPIPEPSTLFLLGSGIIALLYGVRNSNRLKSA